MYREDGKPADIYKSLFLVFIIILIFHGLLMLHRNPLLYMKLEYNYFQLHNINIFQTPDLTAKLILFVLVTA